MIRREMTAEASGQGGLHLINVADPTKPLPLLTIPANAGHVELFDGLAYATVANQIQAYDVVSGELVDSLSLGRRCRRVRAAACRDDALRYCRVGRR